MGRGQKIACWLLAVFYLSAGVLHLVLPGPFIEIVPPWVPAGALVVTLTGLAEIAGAIGLAQPWSFRVRRAAGIGLALYALCVWPANVHDMLLDLAKPQSSANLGYHVPRLAFQPVLIWLALWAGGVIRWPFIWNATKEPG